MTARLPPRDGTACGHWLPAEHRYCRSAARLVRFQVGWRCPLHTPAALDGEPELPDGPGWPSHRTPNPTTGEPT